MLEQLLDSARRQKSRGILTADRYFRSIETCFNGQFCPVKLFGDATQDQWVSALKESESRLVYSDPSLKVKDITTKSVTQGSCLDFDCIVTTTKQDRDGDVLETKGAKADPAMPLLWQHIPIQPIGKLVSVFKQTDKGLMARMAIVDSEMGRDAAQLVEFGALRISHGFNPIEFEPMKEGGWLIKKFEIYEASLVSIPSNPEAIITAFSRGKLHSPLIKGWAKAKFDTRPVSVAVQFEEKPPDGFSSIEEFYGATTELQSHSEQEETPAA